MALDDDMTTPPEEPDAGTPADRAEGSISEDDYLGRDGGADGGAGDAVTDGADGSAGDGGADGGADSGAGGDDPTTESEEDPRFA